MRIDSLLTGGGGGTGRVGGGEMVDQGRRELDGCLSCGEEGRVRLSD